MTVDFETAAAQGRANDLQAALERALAGQCPTVCEEDCKGGCHEGHKPTPGHDPSTCPGFLTQELEIQKLRHAPFHELFEEAVFWKQFGEVAGEVIANSSEMSRMYSTRLREIENFTRLDPRDSPPTVLSKDDLSGWRKAMEAVLALTVSIPDGFDKLMTDTAETLGALRQMRVEREQMLKGEGSNDD